MQPLQRACTHNHPDKFLEAVRWPAASPFESGATAKQCIVLLHGSLPSLQGQSLEANKEIYKGTLHLQLEIHPNSHPTAGVRMSSLNSILILLLEPEGGLTV